MNYEAMSRVFEDLQRIELKLREAGQAEYAHSEDTLSNFKRAARAVGVSPEEVLLIFLLKHIDGITSFIGGHKSQRESVIGRILDARVYLALLAGMVCEDNPTLYLDYIVELEDKMRNEDA